MDNNGKMNRGTIPYQNKMLSMVRPMLVHILEALEQ